MKSRKINNRKKTNKINNKQKTKKQFKNKISKKSRNKSINKYRRNNKKYTKKNKKSNASNNYVLQKGGLIEKYITHPRYNYLIKEKGDYYKDYSIHNLNKFLLEYLINENKINFFFKKVKPTADSDLDWRNKNKNSTIQTDRLFMGIDNFPILICKEIKKKYVITNKNFTTVFEKEKTIRDINHIENFKENNIYENNVEIYNEKTKSFDNYKTLEDIDYIRVITEYLKKEKINPELNSELNPELNLNLSIIRKDLKITLDDTEKKIVLVGFPNIDTLINYEYNNKIKLGEVKQEPVNTLIGDNYESIIRNSIDYNIDNYTNFVLNEKDNFDLKKNINTKLAEKEEQFKQILNLPNTQINYSFIIVEELESEFIPLIFNMRDLSEKHIELLKELNKLIDDELLKKYFIENDIDNLLTNNLYKYCLFGEFFQIHVNFIHPLNKILQFPHIIKRKISFEELIFLVEKNKINEITFEYELNNSKIKPKEIIEPSNKSTELFKTNGSIEQTKVTNKNIFEKTDENIFTNSNIISVHSYPWGYYEIIIKKKESNKTTYYKIKLDPILKLLTKNIIPSISSKIYLKNDFYSIYGLKYNNPIFEVNIEEINFQNTRLSFKQKNVKIQNKPELYNYYPFIINNYLINKANKNIILYNDNKKCLKEECLDLSIYRKIEYEQFKFIILKYLINKEKNTYKYLFWILSKDVPIEQSERNPIKRKDNYYNGKYIQLELLEHIKSKIKEFINKEEKQSLENFDLIYHYPVDLPTCQFHIHLNPKLNYTSSNKNIENNKQLLIFEPRNEYIIFLSEIHRVLELSNIKEYFDTKYKFIPLNLESNLLQL